MGVSNKRHGRARVSVMYVHLLACICIAFAGLPEGRPINAIMDDTTHNHGELTCVLCDKTITKNDINGSAQLCEKGCDTLNHAFEVRGETTIVTSGQMVHTTCRNRSAYIPSCHTRKRHREESQHSSLRSSSIQGKSTAQCIICDTVATSGDTRKSHKLYPIVGPQIEAKLRETCRERDDEWTSDVLARIEAAGDLVAAGKLYHRACYNNFNSLKKIPIRFKQDILQQEHSSAKKQKMGRTVEENKEDAFRKVINHMDENRNVQFTVYELQDKMKSFLTGPNSEPYSIVYMKKKVMAEYGQQITVSTEIGRKDVFTFNDMVDKLVCDNFNDNNPMVDNIAEIAIKISQEINELKKTIDTYPSTVEMCLKNATSYIPESLLKLLSKLFTGKNRYTQIVAIGQAIIQATRPSLVVPLQVGLGVQLHHQFASRALIDEVHTLGFCCSYTDVQKYELNAAVTGGPTRMSFQPGQFAQYIADNVDHNTRTIDGKNTFHGMGIIVSLTPSTRRDPTIVPRQPATIRDVIAVSKINIKYYSSPKTSPESIVYQKLPGTTRTDKTEKVDLLAKSSLLLKNKCPAWSGVMQMVQKGEYPGVSSVIYLPMIDMVPSDPSCIYSTLTFVSDHAARHGVTPILTFDQPLWWKSVNIVNDEPSTSPLKTIVLRLGMFHTQMSFLGTIGHLMAGSGLRDAIELVYAENSVGQMLNGNSVSRAVRGHNLVSSALNTLLISMVCGEKIDLEEDKPEIRVGNVEEEESEDNDEVNSVDNIAMLTTHGNSHTTSDKGISHVTDDCVVNIDESSSDILVANNYCDMANAGSSTIKPVSDMNDGVEIVNMSHVTNIPEKEHTSLSIGLPYVTLPPCETPGMIPVDNTQPSPTQPSPKLSVSGITELLSKVVNGDMSIGDILQSDILGQLSYELKLNSYQLCTSPTPRLWLMYIDMVDILHSSIKAERIGDWQLHLQSVEAMLPYMAAAGHNLYTKSARVYLQNMYQLPLTNPDLHAKFLKGYHVARLSDRYWAGLSTDFLIEEVLMRNVKSRGGLTRDRGVTESQRAIWVMSRPATTEVNDAMNDLTEQTPTRHDQHRDASASTMTKDHTDARKIFNYLKARNPFTIQDDLRNISTGVVGDETVNVHNAKDIGLGIMNEMTGNLVSSCTYKKKHHVITLNSHPKQKKSVKFEIDPILLFQRMVAVVKGNDDVAECFEYELCSSPPAMFTSSSTMREAKKPVLAEALDKLTNCKISKLTQDTHYVLDGGSLLQRYPWSRRSTYDEICAMYVKGVTQTYGTANVYVVFDGYDTTSTKDATHRRRTGGVSGQKVNFSGDMRLDVKKEDFLLNKSNKQRFLHLLGEKLKERGITVIHAEADADTTIAITAARMAMYSPVTVVAEDTDILVLLLFHIDPSAHPTYMKSEKSKSAKIWNITDMKHSLGYQITSNILFLHSILGCDTTSSLFGIGKGTVLTLLTENEYFIQQAAIFNLPSSVTSKDQITSAGEKALVAVYGGLADESLNALRYRRYLQRLVSNNTQVNPCTLPPTSAAAKFHSYRVYYQIQEWKGTSTDLNPTDWGWESHDNELYPTLTDQPYAPARLLKLTRCKCKGDCVSANCSCKKFDLRCSMACKGCRGVSCQNTEPVTADD